MIEEIKNQKLEKIYNILELYYDSSDISLHGGISGVALFQAMYAVFIGNDASEQVANKSIEKVLSIIRTQDNTSPTFCNGLAGVGWMLMYLEEIEFIELSSTNFYSEIDSYLDKFLDNFINNNNWDLLHGSLGIAFYFLKRKKYDIVDKFLNFLSRTAIIQIDEIKWKRFEPYYSYDLYDFGLAHGNASILSFLTLCYKYGIQTDRCKFLINGLISFYKNNTQDESIGSYYSTHISCQDYMPNKYQLKSRVAWCYGDLGILYSIYKASVILGDNLLQQDALKKLVKTSLRRGKDDTSVIDFSICHGSTGNSLIFNELYLATGNLAMKEASEYWLNYTISTVNIDNCKFRESLVDGAKWKDCEYDLLMGLCGLGILLLVTENPDKIKKTLLNNWKEAIFLI